jgi:hypothetical protein
MSFWGGIDLSGCACELCELLPVARARFARCGGGRAMRAALDLA